MSSSAPNTTSMSSSNTNTTVSSTQQPQQQQSQNQNVTESVPSPDTLVQCARLAIQQDKRVMLDYYNDSKADKAFIGQDPDTKERVLIKTKRDFTSLIQKLYKVGEDYLIMTENSIYVVSTAIKMRKISMASLEYDYNDDE
jgi:hypothetical protein